MDASLRHHGPFIIGSETILSLWVFALASIKKQRNPYCFPGNVNIPTRVSVLFIACFHDQNLYRTEMTWDRQKCPMDHSESCFVPPPLYQSVVNGWNVKLCCCFFPSATWSYPLPRGIEDILLRNKIKGQKVNSNRGALGGSSEEAAPSLDSMLKINRSKNFSQEWSISSTDLYLDLNTAKSTFIIRHRPIYTY